MRDGLALEIQIGAATFEGRLPLLPARFKLYEAYADIVEATRIWTPLEEADLLELEEARKEDQTLEDQVEEAPGLKFEDEVVLRSSLDFALLDSDDIAAVCVACIGFCWADEPLEVEAWTVRKRGKPRLETFLLPGQTSQLFRALDRDVISFGDHVTEALSHRGLIDPRELYRAGRKLREQIADSLPSPAEVEEAAEKSEAGGEGCTASTSSRA